MKGSMIRGAAVRRREYGGMKALNDFVPSAPHLHPHQQ